MPPLPTAQPAPIHAPAPPPGPAKITVATAKGGGSIPTPVGGADFRTAPDEGTSNIVRPGEGATDHDMADMAKFFNDDGPPGAKADDPKIAPVDPTPVAPVPSSTPTGVTPEIPADTAPAAPAELPADDLDEGLGLPPKPSAADAAPADPKAEAEKTADGLGAKPSALRSKLVETLETNNKLRSELAQLKAAPAKSKETETLASQLAERETRIRDLEQRLAVVDYEQTTEYHERFHKPYEAAYGEAFRELQGLTTTEGAKLGDDAVASLLASGEREAFRTIAETFTGADARLAEMRVQSLYQAYRARSAAARDAKANATKYQSERQAQSMAMQQQARQQFDALVEARKAEFPDVFNPRDGDAAANRALEQGYDLVSAVFDPERRAQLQKSGALIRLEAEVYNRAAALPAVRVERNVLRDRVKALEAKLARYEGSPGKGQPQPAGGKPAPAPDSDEAYDDTFHHPERYGPA